FVAWTYKQDIEFSETPNDKSNFLRCGWHALLSHEDSGRALRASRPRGRIRSGRAKSGARFSHRLATNPATRRHRWSARERRQRLVARPRESCPRPSRAFLE